ncbi:hypothetical protein PoB_004835100 [Plakobranchus ocellatus]|uniref:Uncharacterized protein n=1 Tax=Plakobranchus ocellatus TaxID=259542 RepID=A0AAV4BN14_9GAST|nr:hypothetical protein PoB_004835100 [Plakobranchus ocellatus]
MMPSASASLTFVESNIVVYIAGYVALKFSSKVCTDCKQVMLGMTDSASTEQVFLQAKSYEECSHGGLQVPSEVLVNAVGVMEEAFRSVTPHVLQTTGLRNMIIKRLMLNDHPSINRLVCPNSKCDLLFYVANLFTNIRLHHHIKLKNFELTTASKGIKRNRKASTFQHQ